MNKKISTPLAIIIILGCSLLVAGLALWQYFRSSEVGITLPEKPAPQDETADWKTYRNEMHKYKVKYPADWKIVMDDIIAVLFILPVTPKSFEDVSIIMVHDVINTLNKYHKKYYTFEYFISEEMKLTEVVSCYGYGGSQCQELISSQKIEVKLGNFSGIQHQRIFKEPPQPSKPYEDVYFIAIETYIPKNNNVYIITARARFEEAEIPSEFLNLYNKVLSTFRFLE